MKNSLIKSFFSFSIGGYISLVIGFFTVPVITRLMTPEEYGIFSLFILIINLGQGIIILGFDQGFIRYYYEEKNKFLLLYMSLKSPLLFFAITIPIFVFFRKEISNFMYQEINIFMVIVLIITLFFYIINRFSILIIRMNKKGLEYSFLQIFQQVSEFLFIMIIYKKYKNSYKTLILAFVLSLLITTFLSIILEKKIWLKNTKEDININTIKLFKYSYPFILTMSLTWIFQSSDKLIIKIFSNLKELGLYAAAFKIVAIINIIQTGFTMFWVPVAYEKYSTEPENKIFFREIFNNISFIMSLLAIIVLMSKELIILLLGEKYYLSSMIMPCLVFMPVMYTVSETTVLGINFSKKTKYHILISLIVAIFNIIGNLILVPKFGSRGAAISTGVAYILFFSLRTFFAKKLINYNFDLNRFYFISFLIFLYSLYLSFYKNIVFDLLLGITLITILSYFYFNEIKIIFKFLQNINLKRYFKIK